MKLLLVAALAICGAISAPTTNDGLQCKAPNGGDLQTLVDDFVKLFPVETLSKIYLNAYCTDPEVRVVMHYLKSDKFKNFVTSIQKTQEFYNLKNYVCENVYFDFNYYLNVVEKIIGLRPDVRPLTTEININRSNQTPRGLQGLVSDIIQNLPLQKISDLFAEMKRTDKNVEKALEQLSSKEFLELTVAVRTSPVYVEMLKDLNGTGANLDGVHLSMSFELLLLLLDSEVISDGGYTCL